MVDPTPSIEIRVMSLELLVYCWRGVGRAMWAGMSCSVGNRKIHVPMGYDDVTSVNTAVKL
ncbi:hypothetical protein E2C01_041138 [Portunus trituberculatus]|uniref:Uncharacterized protein n=1 Tax=Portunus trituberculatus TaxID=210409 RepID=A0A5B7FQV5_PORTR|nr:hypothetical protein [Portunus trituberculatus]